MESSPQSSCLYNQSKMEQRPFLMVLFLLSFSNHCGLQRMQKCSLAPIWLPRHETVLLYILRRDHFQLGLLGLEIATKHLKLKCSSCDSYRNIKHFICQNINTAYILLTTGNKDMQGIHAISMFSFFFYQRNLVFLPNTLYSFLIFLKDLAQKSKIYYSVQECSHNEKYNQSFPFVYIYFLGQEL